MTAASDSALAPDLIEELLTGGNPVRMEVAGVSMAPRLRDHDHVVVKPLGGEDARIGDLLLFRNTAGALILHRLVRRWQDNNGQYRLQTRGDTCLRLDNSIEPERVLGRVCHIERTGVGRIDLETAGERARAVIVAAGKLMCSAAYYKLLPTRMQNKIAEAPSSK